MIGTGNEDINTGIEIPNPIEDTQTRSSIDLEFYFLSSRKIETGIEISKFYGIEFEGKNPLHRSTPQHCHA
jgi:hypothetical protein